MNIISAEVTVNSKKFKTHKHVKYDVLVLGLRLRGVEEEWGSSPRKPPAAHSSILGPDSPPGKLSGIQKGRVKY